MSSLFGRQWKVRIDTIETTKLSIGFNVEKSTKHEPNKCTLRIWNLTPDHRKQLEALNVRKKSGSGKIRVEIYAGYEDPGPGLIFRGDLRVAMSDQEGGDWVTQIEGEDGGRAALTARVNRSFPAGTEVRTVVEACAEAMGVGLGNTRELAANASTAVGRTFPEGTVLSGAASKELASILRSCGLRYSIQNGVLQVMRRGQALSTSAVLLSPTTGLVGRPKKNVDGTIEVTALLNPDIYPGRRVKIESKDVQGVFEAQRVTYVGESRGNDWYCNLVVKT